MTAIDALATPAPDPAATTPSTTTTTRRTPRSGRLWGASGAVAGLAGVVAIQSSLQVDAAYSEDAQGAEAIADRLADQVPQLVALHVSSMVACVLLLVVAAGLRRRLQDQAPAGSLLPDVAAGGLLLTAVVALMGSAFTTETIFAIGDEEWPLTTEFAAVVAHWVGTVPWLWMGAGVTGVAVAVASLRHAAAPRWLGWVCAVLGGLTLVAGMSPMQYLAGMPGPVLVLLLGLGFALGDRRDRPRHG
ncbi:hypothetical protein G6553_03890 [Nocardioides sp. IC4_145]|uniref:hypothetical protein n=1 Tax=Nocardioides sp. IC4_145 TaxID=2714037 RepID=UPI0014096790|nr:hypothetical protein [Nocardioides sp. IC4_145]NHC22316.1 hypothetical protein [Nocardioides sp. IC4_145]